MKKHCTGLAVLFASLAAFGVANAQIAFYGVIDPNTHDVVVDSAAVFAPTRHVYPTLGWGGTTIDTFFDFPDQAGWPDSVQLYGRIDIDPNVSMFPSPAPNTWYIFAYGGIVAPKALFYSGLAGVQEPKSAIGPVQRLRVSPSVVTGQMMVRLQPVGSGRQVVQIHDAVGNVIRSLDCASGTSSAATATWNREDEFGRLVPEGVYFCRYAASGVVAVRKVLVTH